MDISVVVPIYNEQDNVASLIEEIERALVAFTSPWELIIVDDGSKDEVAEAIAIGEAEDGEYFEHREPDRPEHGAVDF